MLDAPCLSPRMHTYLPDCVLCPMLTGISGSLAPSSPHVAWILPKEKTAVDPEGRWWPSYSVAAGCPTLGDLATRCPHSRTIRTLTDRGASSLMPGLGEGGSRNRNPDTPPGGIVLRDLQKSPARQH